MMHRFTIFPDRSATEGISVAREWSEWLWRLRQVRVSEAKDGTAIIFGGAKRLAVRRRYAIVSHTAIALDCDTMSPHEAAGVLDAHGFTFVAHSTHSGIDRSRVIVPLSRPVSPPEWLWLHWSLAQLIQVDPTDHTWHRAHYWPSRPPTREGSMITVGGRTLAPGELERPTTEEAEAAVEQRFPRVLDRISRAPPVELAGISRNVPDPVLWWLYRDNADLYRAYYDAALC